MIWDIDPTLIGPYPLPWHALLALLDVSTVIFVFWSWRKNGTLNSEQWMWPALALGGHIFYTLQLAEANPTFELEIRYYGVAFAIGLLGAARAFPVYFERWGFDKKHAEALTLWTPIGMLLGAHFIHLIFYETDSLINNPIRIFQLGSGLASHGGGLGAIVAVIWYARRQGVNPMKMMDPAMCGATYVIPWVRVGNFFNSEIVGREWHGPFAIVFPRHDCPGYPSYERAGRVIEVSCDNALARHPSQVYEAILAFIMLGLAIYLAAKWRHRLRPGAILFILLAYYFTTRFFIEYTKEYQTLSDGFPLTMGQCLSLPIVLVSVYMLAFSKTSNIRTTINDESVLDDPPFEPGLSPDPAQSTPQSHTAKKPKQAAPQAEDAEVDSSETSSDDDGEAPKRRKKKKKKRR